MKLIKNIYNYLLGDYWNNHFNTVLVEYYTYLLCWFPLAFNS